jgi:hypothetical protein
MEMISKLTVTFSIEEMSNRTLSLKQILKKQELIPVFEKAVNENDALSQRNSISSALRLATISELDGLEILYHVLGEKFAPAPALELHRESHPVEDEKPYKCPNAGCTKSYDTAKGLAAHGPHKLCKHRK